MGTTQTRPRILVVDDSEAVLEVARRALETVAYEVETTTDGDATVALAEASRPNLILLDLAMPKTNGFDVCRALGEHAKLAEVPIVLMHTRGDAVAERFIATFAVSDHISKPFSPEAIVAVVEHALRRHRPPPPRPAPPTGPLAHTVEAPTWPLASYLAAAVGDHKKLAQKLHVALATPEGQAHIRSAAAAAPPALVGDLAIVPVAEILQLLALQRQTGFLTVRHGAAAIAVAFDAGEVQLVTGEQMGKDFLLGTILIQERLLEPHELGALLESAAGAGERLGEQMLRSGRLDEAELHRALTRQSSELVYEMLRWRSGRFEFQPRAGLPEAVLAHPIGLGIDALLMEGFRRVDEWGLIETVLPSFDVVLAPTPGAHERGAAQGLGDAEREQLDRVDGKRTVRELVTLSGAPTFDVARLLYRLVAAHYVVVQPGGDRA